LLAPIFYVTIRRIAGDPFSIEEKGALDENRAET